MTKKLEDVLEALPKTRREAIERRGAELHAEHFTLKELRKARELTQRELAKVLNVTQENISNLEKRSDIMVSTLRNHIEAMGGELNITVKFPTHEPVHLAGIGTNAPIGT